MLFHIEPRAKKKYRIARVGIGQSQRFYDFICNDVFIHPGDSVLIPTEKGEEEAVVLEIAEHFENELKTPIKEYKQLNRGRLVHLDNTN